MQVEDKKLKVGFIGVHTHVGMLSCAPLAVVSCGNGYGNLANGSVNADNGTLFRSRVEFSCIEGLTLIGNRFRECLSDGNWSGAVPTCEGESPISN